jgi:hypothetical protein
MREGNAVRLGNRELLEYKNLPRMNTNSTDCLPFIFPKILFDAAESLADNRWPYGKLGMA